MGDHNFSDLKEFALGLGGNMTESDNTASGGLKQTIHVPYIPSMHPSPSVQTETAAAPHNGTRNPYYSSLQHHTCQILLLCFKDSCY